MYKLKRFICELGTKSVSYQYITIAQNQIWKFIHHFGELQVKAILSFYSGTDYNPQITKEMTHGSERNDLVLPLWCGNCILNQDQIYSMKPTPQLLLGPPCYCSLLFLPSHFFKAHIFFICWESLLLILT